MTIKDEKGLDNHTFADGEKYAYDPTFEAIKAAEKEYPGCDLFIVSLGTGEVSRQFGDLILSRGDTIPGAGFPLESRRHQKDRHLGYLDYIKKSFKQQGRKVKSIRLQLPIDSSLSHDPDINSLKSLRDAGLSFTNPQHKKYKKFEKVLRTFKSWPTLGRVSLNSIGLSLTGQETNPNARPWQGLSLTGYLLNNLYIAPQVEGFMETFPPRLAKSYLTLLWEQLHTKQTVTLPGSCSKASLAGMGGIGKTSLAAQYAQEAYRKKAYHLIYWLPSETLEGLEEGYKRLLKLLKVPVEDNADLVALVNEHLSSQQPFLLIYDNVPNPVFLHKKIPLGGHILMTSRCREGWGKTLISLDVFQPAESIRYLCDKTGLHLTPHTKQSAEDLAHELGNLPLALSHAASYIRHIRGVKEKYQFANYLKSFRKQPSTHFEKAQVPFMKEPEEASEISHEYLVAKTMQLSGRHISDKAKELLRYFAYLDPDQLIREPFLKKGEDKNEVIKAIGQLATSSLIKKNGATFSMHRLVQLVERTAQESNKDCRQAYKLLEDLLGRFSGFWQEFSSNRQEKYSVLQAYQIISYMLAHLTKIDEHLGNLERIEETHQISPPTPSINLLRIHGNHLQNLWKKTRFSLTGHAFQQRSSHQDDEKARALLPLFHKEVIEAGIELSEEECYNLFSLYPNIYLSKIEFIEIARSFRTLNSLQRQNFPHTFNFFRSLGTEKLLGLDKDEHMEIMVAVAEIIKFVPFNLNYKEKYELIIKDLCKQKLSLYDQTQIINFLIAINPFHNAISMTRARKYAEESINKELIKELSQIKVEDWEEFISIIKNQLEDRQGYNTRYLSAKVNDFNTAQLDQLSTLAREIISDPQDKQERARIVGNLLTIKAKYWNDFINFIKELPTNKINEEYLIRVITAFTETSFENRSKFMVIAQELSRGNISKGDQFNILKFFWRINEQYWKKCEKKLFKQLTISQSNKKALAFAINSLAKIDTVHWERVTLLARGLITENMSEYDLARLIEILGNIEEEDRNRVVSSAKELITRNMSGSERAHVIASLAKIKGKDWDKFGPLAKKLIVENMSEYDLTRVIEILRNIEEEEEKRVVSSAKELITRNMLGSERAHVIASLAKIKGKDWDKFGPLAKEFTTGNMSGSERAQVITSLASIKGEDWDKFGPLAKELITRNMSGSERAQVITSLAKIKGKDWDKFGPLAKEFTTGNMSRSGRAQVIEALARIKGKDWDKFGPLAKEFTTGNMSRSECAQVIASLASIKGEDWDKFGPLAKEFTTGNMSRSERAQVIASLAKIKGKDWDKFGPLAKEFITGDMSGYGRTQVMEALAKIEEKDWDKFVPLAKEFITGDMLGSGRAQVIEALAKIEEEDWDKFVHSVERLITENMNGSERAHVIASLASIKEENWNKFVSSAKGFTIGNMSGYELAKVIMSLASIKEENWNKFVSSAKESITENMPEDARILIISAFAEIDREHWEKVALFKGLISNDRNGYAYARIIEFVSKKKAGNWDEFAFLVKELTTHETSLEECLSIINSLIRVAEEKRAKCTNLTKTLVTCQMNGYQRAAIIDSFAKIKVEYWKDCINQARNLITNIMDGHERARIITLVGHKISRN